jgi:heat shock protein HtpX
MAYEIEERARRAASLRNLIHSLALVGGIGLIMAFCAYLLWGRSGVVWAFVLLGVLLLMSPRITPELIIRMYGARRVVPQQGGQLLQVVSELTRRAELPVMPELYVIPSSVINAFATGHRSAPILAVTQGMLNALEPRELIGVLSHEMAHVRNSDLWIMSIADTMSRFTHFMSMTAVLLFFFSLPTALLGMTSFPLLPIIILYFAPTLTGLLQLGLSRTREYEADLEGARLSGDPEGLASALHKIERQQGSILETIFIPGRRVPVPSLLRTHPPTEERIRRLLALREVRRPAIQTPGRQTPGGMEPVPSLFASTRPRPRYHVTGLWY